jgi:transposase-like protein
MLGEGKDVADVCRELGVAEQTYYRWRNQFGGMSPTTPSGLRVWSGERHAQAAAGLAWAVRVAS